MYPFVLVAESTSVAVVRSPPPKQGNSNCVQCSLPGTFEESRCSLHVHTRSPFFEIIPDVQTNMALLTSREVSNVFSSLKKYIHICPSELM